VDQEARNMMLTLEPVAPPAITRGADERIKWRTSLPFIAVHLVPLAIFFTGVTTRAVLLFAGCYAVRLLCITAGYHRYFSHRSYRVSRPVQFLLALVGSSAAQKGPLWWAGEHRLHHRYVDGERDPHTPAKGFWFAHVGWILTERNSTTDFDLVKDLACYPELRFVDRYDWIGPWALALFCLAVGGWSGLVVGFFLSTVVLWHVTFAVNSVGHVFGRRRYDTADTSRNSFLLALLTGGEGWHNNHHRYPPSARQGFRWWQFDATWLTLRALALVRVVHDLKVPSAAILHDRLARRAPVA
jgi:stearoyl-CoA desaturase (Delta-9 desaturase)